MIFLHPSNNRPDWVIVFGYYYPERWRRYRPDDKHKEHSERVSALKRRHGGAIEYFNALINPKLGYGFSVATVPSHDPANPPSGIRLLGQRLALYGRMDATMCLHRYLAVAPAHTGRMGDRDVEIEMHKRTITVICPELIWGQHVLLLDDVCTTGASLQACNDLLLQAGARVVQRAALGMTFPTKNWTLRS